MQQDLLMPGSKAAIRQALSSPLWWMVFFAYLLVLGYTAAHHEPWGDELHSWNIAKGSAGFFDLIQNSRFEGHPPAWYTILWVISKFTHDFSWVQAIHAFIGALTVFAIIFLSPLPRFARLLLPFGYFFLYEYAVLSRNYAIAILAAVCICIILRRSFRFKWPLYYFLLLVMSNAHLLALVLAGCLHLYCLLFTMEKKGSVKAAAVHVLAGALIFLPAVYFITPPSESQLNVHFWMDRWKLNNIKTSGQAPLRSFLPLPAWWKYNIWNTQFLLDAANKSIVLNFFVALVVVGMSLFIVRSNKKSLIIFVTNLLLSLFISIAVFPLTSTRYAGFLFIGFVVSWWLFCYETPVSRINRWLVMALLFIQLIAGSIFVVQDIRYPFSNANKVTELMKQVPTGEKVVTDYWALNAVSAFADRPLYCVDMQKEISFVMWGPELGEMLKNPYRYYDGVTHYLKQAGVDQLYMISFATPELLFKTDPKLESAYQVEVAAQTAGAIEKGSNLYLYRVSSK